MNAIQLINLLPSKAIYKKIVVTRDVTFDENKFFYHINSGSTPKNGGERLTIAFLTFKQFGIKKDPKA